MKNNVQDRLRFRSNFFNLSYAILRNPTSSYVFQLTQLQPRYVPPPLLLYSPLFLSSILLCLPSIFSPFTFHLSHFSPLTFHLSPSSRRIPSRIDYTKGTTHHQLFIRCFHACSRIMRIAGFQLTHTGNRILLYGSKW